MVTWKSLVFFENTRGKGFPTSNKMEKKNTQKVTLERLHPRKQTWNLKVPPWKRRNIYKPPIVGFHVCFREGNSKVFFNSRRLNSRRRFLSNLGSEKKIAAWCFSPWNAIPAGHQIYDIFRIGDPKLNLHLPLESWEGATGPKIFMLVSWEGNSSHY